MTDQINTKSNQSDDAKKLSSSPWDEDLPEEPKKNLVVGSLDSTGAKNIDQDKKPVPFNIPENISDEKVGKKIPAEEIVKKAEAVAPPKNQIKTEDSASLPKESKIVPVIPPSVPIPVPPAPSAPPKVVTPAVTSPADKSKMQNSIPTGKEGVSELVEPKKEVIAPTPPAPTPIPPETSPKVVAPVTPIESAPKEASISPATPTAKKPPLAKEKRSMLSRLNPFGRAKPEPQKKDIPKPILPDIGKAEPEVEHDQKVDSISNIKASFLPENNINDQPEDIDFFAPEQKSYPPPDKTEKETPAPIRRPVTEHKPSFFKRPGFIITASIIILLTSGIYLTEAGLISVGLEKIYGIFGLESLWGGLPRNPEKALAKSALAMKDELNFKVKGSMTLTVNKTIKSSITTPLVSIVTIPYALRDENVSGATKGVLAQYDYYGSSDSSDSSTDSNDSSTPSPSDSATPSSTNYGSQQDSVSYQPEESTIKQIDIEFEGESGEDAIKNEINIKKLVGSDSTISLIGNKNDLYVKTSPDIKYADNADSSKWLDFNIANISENNPVKDFANIKLDKGFSIIGRRSGNEKAGGVRCFKYSVDNLEIGDSLDYLGIKSDSVSEFSGSVWIGVVDHFIHKVDLKITPSIASSISQISLNFELYDYGVENSIVIPALSDKIIATPTVASAVAPATSDQGDIYSRDKVRKADLVAIKSALEKYKQSNGSYPISKNMLKLNIDKNIVQKSLVPEFITALPSDPKAADGWYYAYESNGTTFKLSARLENSADPQVTRVGEVYVHWVYN